MTTFTPHVNSGSRVLIATLGGKPQVVTFALDSLGVAGVLVESIYVVHLSAKDTRIQRSLDKLRADLKSQHPDIRLESVPIRAPRFKQGMPSSLVLGRAIERIDDPETANAVWLTMHRLISTLKSNGTLIDLCLAGGPRLISLQALSVATLLFTPQDHYWHLYTPEELREQAGEGDIMHAPIPALSYIAGEDEGKGPHLIAVPLVPMGVIFPNLQSAMYLSPQEIIADRTQRLSALELQCYRDVMRVLTPRQRDVLRAFACRPVETDVKGVAKQLHLSISAVNTHKTVILQQCRNVWALPTQPRLTHHFLHQKFSPLPESFWAEWITIHG